ncbi:hypothetical protein [Phytohabitans houttuyneae]|uniref:Uncharacterized protein n=1 Tax=Phytohabitans houttuyneae TaxID=1076126 RepID=A0A6V8K4D7_9ACTN|nr:hypothetical protein [Phytohabitans houttuyneae]GFJ77261.1 hypothetical protein Phou_014410 [Phytohabitans houttuyneae]
MPAIIIVIIVWAIKVPALAEVRPHLSAALDVAVAVLSLQIVAALVSSAGSTVKRAAGAALRALKPERGHFGFVLEW